MNAIVKQTGICYNTPMSEIETVTRALMSIRAPRTACEYDLHRLVAEAMAREGIPFGHEVPLAPRRRIDFLCGGVGVEIKRGRPQRTPLLRQLAAYAACESVRSLVLIADHPPRLPDAVCGKPLQALSLQRLWGIAL